MFPLYLSVLALTQGLTYHGKLLSDLMDMPFRAPYGFRKLETLPGYLLEDKGKENKYWHEFHSKHPQLQVGYATREMSWGTREAAAKVAMLRLFRFVTKGRLRGVHQCSCSNQVLLYTPQR